MTAVPKAAMLAIGDELLSGRTKDKNIGFLADHLVEMGMELKEVRIVGDDQGQIIEAINALRSRYDYVFTSGGIGPTHDDITAQAIADALNLPLIIDAKADQLLKSYSEKNGKAYTAARQRMARMPQGARHIKNAITTAPGFIIENVYVMAGVPEVFQSMLLEILPWQDNQKKCQSLAISCPFGEGEIADDLARIQQEFPLTSIGSYPKFTNGRHRLELVIRSYDEEALNQAGQAIHKMIDDKQNPDKN